jgi:hypothetical protein
MTEPGHRVRDNRRNRLPNDGILQACCRTIQPLYSGSKRTFRTCSGSCVVLLQARPTVLLPVLALTRSVDLWSGWFRRRGKVASVDP